MERIRWGIMGTADIALRKVIPGLRRGRLGEVRAIASRSGQRAKEAAQRLEIPRWHGSYESLLGDPEVDAVYIPLPNSEHVPWSLRAMEAGKHVLCEKPVALDAAGARRLLEAARERPELKVMEAFMYRFHPQWQRAVEMVRGGGIGELRAVDSFFSYYNDDPSDIRNQRALGGGGMLDIGCYNVSVSRLLFGAEPRRVLGIVETDPQLGVDTLASGILDFGAGRATFTCGTRVERYQRVNAVGTRGRVEIEIPFNAPPDQPCRIWLARAGEVEEITLPVADQYALQGDAFARAVLEGLEVPTPLTDAVANMEVIEAVFRSSARGAWVSLG